MINLKKVIAMVAIASIVVPSITITSANAQTRADKVVNEKYAKDVDFGVGQGIVWPNQVNSPYIDMVAWTSNPKYSNNGAANLSQISIDTGVKFFNLGFIQASGDGIKDGKVNWCWGGYPVLSEGNNNDQYDGIKKSLKNLRGLGGDAAISFGGNSGVAFWQQTQDVNVLTSTYLDIIKGYGLTRIDLDIEGAAQDKAENIANAKAIKKVQDETGINVVITLPVLPSGLTNVQLDVLEAYLSEGVNLKVVNLMTMCYGSGTLLPGENYGTASLRAVDSVKDQLKDYYKKYAGVTLTDGQAYGKIGTTVSIGFESEAHPIFTTAWSNLVVNDAIANKLAMTSFWSMNRDAMIQDNKGVTKQYEFTNIFKKFGSTDTPEPPVTENANPVLNGVNDVTIKVGEEFNPLKDVTATDREDGNLTSKIVVKGSVDVNKEGTYKLSYNVTDNDGATTTKDRTVTVKSESTSNVEAYDSNKVYLEGDKVSFKGNTYVAKWWVKGEDPDKSQAWKVESTSNADGSVDYIQGNAYDGGTLVRYNGKVYKAKWWTNTVPGSDNTWELVK